MENWVKIAYIFHFKNNHMFDKFRDREFTTSMIMDKFYTLDYDEIRDDIVYKINKYLVKSWR
jgi:hypothetical protein